MTNREIHAEDLVKAVELARLACVEAADGPRRLAALDDTRRKQAARDVKKLKRILRKAAEAISMAPAERMCAAETERNELIAALFEALLP